MELLTFIFTILLIPAIYYLGPDFITYLIVHLRRRPEKKSLHAQIVEYRKELSKISQVDEFAKYSKVQRKLRASTDQLSTISREDLEVSVKYRLAAFALACLLVIVLIFKILTYLMTFIF